MSDIEDTLASVLALLLTVIIAPILSWLMTSILSSLTSIIFNYTFTPREKAFIFAAAMLMMFLIPSPDRR